MTTGTSTLTGLRHFVNQAYQRGGGGWHDFTVERCVRAWLFTASIAPADADTRLVIIADFNDIARYMTKPFCAHAEVHGLRFQQLRLISHSPARCACLDWYSQRHPFRDVTTVTGNGLRVLHKLSVAVSQPLSGQSSSPSTALWRFFQGAEAVAERRAIIRHHHITAVIDPHLIRRSVPRMSASARSIPGIQRIAEQKSLSTSHALRCVWSGTHYR